LRKRTLSDVNYIDNIPDGKLRAFAQSIHLRLEKSQDKRSDLLKTITKLRRELEIPEDGFRFHDIPSLNLIIFDKDGRPTCEEHGVMNRYENTIYRCVTCGVAINMKNRRAIVI